jgi:hypothetical protein
MVDVFAVALEVGVDFLFGKMQRLCPADVSAFQQSYFAVLAVVFLFKCAVT